MLASVHSYELDLKPSWSEVEGLRQFIGPWVYALVRIPDVRDAVATVSAELLENAIRYGHPDVGAIGYRIDVGEEHVRVSVTNRCVPGKGDPERAEERVRWIERFEDSTEAYREQVRRVARGESGGLGLVRIAAEGHSRLRCSTRADTLEMEATTRFRKRPISGGCLLQ